MIIRDGAFWYDFDKMMMMRGGPAMMDVRYLVYIEEGPSYQKEGLCWTNNDPKLCKINPYLCYRLPESAQFLYNEYLAEKELLGY